MALTKMPCAVSGGGSKPPYATMFRASNQIWGILLASTLKDYKYVKLMTSQEWIDMGGTSTESAYITQTSITMGVNVSGTRTAYTLTTSPISVSTLNLENASIIDFYDNFSGSTKAFAIMFYDD